MADIAVGQLRRLLEIWLVAVVVLLCAETTCALPPLGLTQIDSRTLAAGDLSILNGTGYVSGVGGVWALSPDGVVEFTAVNHPELGGEAYVRQVVKADDGNLYMTANFRGLPPDGGRVLGGALFQLTDATMPVQTIESSQIDLVGVDRRIMFFGNFTDPQEGRPVVYFPDGFADFLELPLDSVGLPIFAEVFDVSESGYVVGGATRELFREDAAIWTPDGDFSFLYNRAPGPDAPASSVRDRPDGNGINVGILREPTVVYGDQPPIFLERPFGDFHFSDNSTIVSQTEFAVVNDVGGVFGYYPGIVPDNPAMVRPLDEIFPALSGVNFDRVGDLYAIDGRIYMTLSGPDGLFLFGARDPSVIPEPSTLALAGVLVALCGWRWRRGRGR